ncbi:MAG TPA: C45 family peptidase [Bacteroidota bacterium]|nr:C45 family peptidase [Bacteroidota bacterium]
MTLRSVLAIALTLCALSCSHNAPGPGKGTRTENNGWIVVHLEGTPREIGRQHGELLAGEIDDALKMIAHFLQGSTKKEWGFYREAAERMFWPKIDAEYREEIEGIVEGLRSRGMTYDRADIVALNGWMELALYYLPALAQKINPDSMNNRAPGNCSAFIATGSYTSDGRIVMGHNSWVDYIVGERWNIIADIVPEHGNRIFMDCYPGFIHSGDDFVENSAGILITETTITQFKGFDENGIPEFSRARKAAQYASSIDQFDSIMTAGNNGGYANTWLVGDTRTNEIGKLDLGLKHTRLWRTHDGAFVGSNFATDEGLLQDETTFDTHDSTNSPLAREKRWNELMAKYRGKLDAEAGMAIEADHGDATTGGVAENRCVLCGHIDKDGRGAPWWDEGPYYPMGAVQGKVTTAALAGEMKFWARMGHPCGEDFIASTFLTEHPEYQWQEPYLKDMKSHPWTLFAAHR